MKISRNAPCHCGSGKKYKKCCLMQDEINSAGPSIPPRNTIPTGYRVVESEDELDRLSNRANDLIAAERWDEAAETCRELMEQFPEEIDGDDRFSQYYKKRGNFDKARAHARAALEKAEANPDKFDPELITDLKEEIDYLNECIRAGHRVE